MKKLLYALISSLISLTLLGPAFAQTQNSGQITTSTASCPNSGATTLASNGKYVVLQVPGSAGGIGISILGTFSGTVNWYVTAGGGDQWVAPNESINVASGASATSTTSAGVFRASAAGVNAICVLASALASGTVEVNIQTTAGSASKAGGGSFTAAQDLSGTSSSQEVIGILTHALPSLATGYLNWTGTAWNFGTVTPSLPSGNLAQILTNTTGSTTYAAKNPIRWDATIFHSATGCGTDAGCDAQNALSWLANNGLNLGGTVSLENETTIDIQHDPFCGNTSYGSSRSPLKAVLILSDHVTNTFEVPMTASAGGCTLATFTPGNAVITGAGPYGKGEGSGLASPGGPTLKAGSSFPPAGSTNTPCGASGATGQNLCTTLHGQVIAYVNNGSTTSYNWAVSQGNGTTATCGLTFVNSAGAANGEVCVIGTSTQFTTDLVAEGIIIIPYNQGATTQVVGRIDGNTGILDNTHMVLSTQIASPSTNGITSNSGYAVAYAGIQMGIQGQAFNGVDNQGIELSHFTLDMSNIAGSIGIANYSSAEENIVEDVIIANYTLIGLDTESVTAQEPHYDFNMFSPGTKCGNDSTNNITTVDLMISVAVPYSVSRSTFANGHGCDSGSTQGIGVVTNVGFHAYDNHSEQKNPAFMAQIMPTCNAYPCPPLVTFPSAKMTNMRIDKWDFNCFIGGGCTNAIEIGSGFNGVANSDFNQISCAGAAGTTNLINDLQASNTELCSHSTNSSYHIDQSGHVWTNAPTTDLSSSGTAEVDNAGVLSWFNAGTLEAQINGLTGAAKFAGGVATGTATVPTAPVYISLPAGGEIQSADTGSPTITFGTNSVAVNQPFTATSYVVGSSNSAANLAEGTLINGDICIYSNTGPTLNCNNTTVHSLNFEFGTSGGSAIPTGILGYQTVPVGCAIAGWSIEADAGTDTVKWLKVAAGTAIPTLSNSISTSGVSLSTGTAIQSTTLTDFTTITVTANDIVAADLITTSGTGYIDAQLKVSCTQ
jgi:hypothetical protein